MLLKFMKQTSTNSSVAFKKYLVSIIKSLLVFLALWLMPSITKADSPIPTSVVSNYSAALQRLTVTIKWSWGSTSGNKHVGAAMFADLNNDGITPTIFDNPATYTSGGNQFPAGLQARDEFLGQLAVSNIEGSASSTLFAGSDNTDNGIASGVSGITSTSARVLFPYLGNSMAVVNSSTGTFTLTYNNVPVSPSRLCVVLYDPHSPFNATGGHSVTSAGPGRNTDNSVEDGNSQGTVPCNSLVVLSCAINKTETACQTQAAINASYAAWLGSVTASGCNGVLTNNSTGAPSATGGSKTVTFTYTQNGCSNQAAVTTCTATFTVPPCTGSIGDFVWEDLNRNGLQDAGEPGIGGVTVTLSGSSSATTTTAANGSYSFNNLQAGTYSVTFATPTAPGQTFVPTTSNVGANDAIDSDPVGGVVSNIVLAAGEVKNTVDAGFYRLLNLSGNVWHDVNGMLDSLVNNTRGDTAAVIPTGLKMILVDANTSLVVRTNLVQGNGAFNFPNIDPGTYILVLKVEGANIADPSPFASIPEGWRNTGERLGLNLAKVPPLHDGVINGKLTVTVSTVSVTNANFGINFGGEFPVN